MTAKIRRIDFSFDEWIAGCLGLNEEQEGIYIRLTARHGSRGKPVDIDGLAAYCNCDKRKFWRITNELWRLKKVKVYDLHGEEIEPTSARLLPEVGEKLAIPRMEVELSLARSRTEVAANMANKRWNNNVIGDADTHMRPRNANHQPSTINHHNGRASARNGFAKNDPYGLAGLDHPELRKRFNAAKYGSDEREAIRRAMED